MEARAQAGAGPGQARQQIPVEQVSLMQGLLEPHHVLQGCHRAAVSGPGGQRPGMADLRTLDPDRSDLQTCDPDRSDLQTCQLLIGGRGVRLTRARHPRGLEHLGAQHLVGGQAGDLLEHALSQGVVGVPVGEALTGPALGRQPRALR